MLRLDQSSVNGFRDAMVKFLPHYIDYDNSLPTELEYNVGLGRMLFGIFNWDVLWTDIKYTDTDFDIKDIKFDLKGGAVLPLIKIDFPSLKDWTITAHQKIKNTWILPDGNIVLTFKDFKIAMETDIKIDGEGYLEPKIYSVDIDFGKSDLHHDNWFIKLFLW
jgi:hypothetical protein